jgi:hypothetical protein
MSREVRLFGIGGVSIDLEIVFYAVIGVAAIPVAAASWVLLLGGSDWGS